MPKLKLNKQEVFMAPCCNNIVTPKMIRAGRVSVGDRIQFEDDYISARSDELFRL